MKTRCMNNLEMNHQNHVDVVQKYRIHMARYQTLKQAFTITSVVKKSRFIATASPLATESEAKVVIEQLRDRKASHNCWAYRVDEGTGRHSDDGEPSGTAGAPILRSITGGNFVRVAVVVTRYFGGVKLGSGGLARAYGGVAAECLAAAPRIECATTVDVQVSVEFASVGAVFAVVERYTRLDCVFSEVGCVVKVRILDTEREEFLHLIREVSKGSAVVEFLGARDAKDANVELDGDKNGG